MEVTIFERSRRVLAKVAVSGGGRCNCTNSFAHVSDLSQVYPRGHRLLKRLFHEFDHRSAYRWFEGHGIRLVTQDDDCVFPATQSSQTVIDCFTATARRLGIHIETGRPVESVSDVDNFDFVAVTTGGQPQAKGLQWLADMGHRIEPPVPSLFSFTVKGLEQLMGIVADSAVCHIPGTKLRTQGPLLITHWGMSGPAILKLSSHAARLLADNNYHMPLSINWTGDSEAAVIERLYEGIATMSTRQVANARALPLPSRLWNHLVEKAGVRKEIRWGDVNKKEVNRLSSVLTNATYDISGRAPFKDEFVTCGGVSLQSVNPSTMESRLRPGLYFAGEVLDVDGVTGGFNFQAAWTTAYCAARAIAASAAGPDQEESLRL